MNRGLEIKSILFPACKGCESAAQRGMEQNAETLIPALCYTPPSENSDITAKVTCEQMPDNQIIALTEVTVNGTFHSSETAPIECPAVQTPV